MTDLFIRARAALADLYPLERQLGEGGAAVVYLAEDRKHHRRVAVKVLRPEVAGALGAERFLREIELAARLSHPHILTLIDSGTADGLLYYVMPYVESDSLRTRLQREGRFTVDEALDITRSIAGALDHAHRHGIVHRDIKPENILLQGGLPVVTDFGIATALTTAGGERLTATGIAVGTPAYMSPEQVAGDPSLDGRSDMYSLGCVLYEMLTGDPPFSGPSAQAIMGKRIIEPEPMVSARRADVSGEVDRVVRRAMAKEPTDRFETGGQFAQALAMARTGAATVTAKESEETSIAVLPLINLSADPENEYFSDGVSEEIMHALAQVPRLRVTARTSAFAFKGTNRDVREIGRRLGVSYVLEGSVRRSGQRIRLSAQLIDVAGGHQLWSERYDRELTDIFAVQDEIAAMIATRLKAGFSADVAPRQRTKRNLDAYDAYLRGRFDVAKGTPELLLRSIDHFERAIRLDTYYAEAYLGIAEALSFYALLGPVPPETIVRARASVARALELDDQLPEAHASLGCLQFWFEWNWAEAERSLVRAVELGPNSAIAHYHYVALLANLGRADEAVSFSRRVIELDPLWVVGHHIMGFSRFQAGNFLEASEAAGRALAISPDFLVSIWVTGFAQVAMGRLDEAVASFQRALATSPGDSGGLSGLVKTYARMGRIDEARALLRDIEERAARGGVLTSALIWAYCALEEKEKAIDQLHRLAHEHDVMVVSLPSFAWWDLLRGHPRFEALLTELKFPAYSLACSDSRRVRFAAGRAASVPAGVEPGATPSSKPVVAVLPLRNLSSNADDEYFADGMTEDVIAQLSQIASLRVISRTSAMRYKTSEQNMKEIAAALGATHVVEGSVRRAAHRLRIVAQLIEASTDAHLWAQTFDRELTDVFAVQSEVAEQVVTALRTRLAPEEKKRLSRKPTEDQEAYNLFLLARHHANLATADGFGQAMSYYERAVQRDPLFGRAWAALAQSRIFHLAGYYGVRPRDAAVKVVECASRALTIDDDIAEAHSALGMVASLIDFNWDAARVRQERALLLSPNLASVHLQHGNHLMTVGRMSEAVDEAHQALELDPASEYVHVHANWIRYATRRFEEAMIGLEAAEHQFGRKVLPLTRGETLIAVGRASESVESFRELYSRIPITWNLGHLAWGLAAAGQDNEARAALKQLHENEAREYVWPLAFALPYAHLGDMDRAFDYLQRAVEDRAAWVQMPYSPTFDPFRDDPRFDAILKQIGAVAPQSS